MAQLLGYLRDAEVSEGCINRLRTRFVDVVFSDVPELQVIFDAASPVPFVSVAWLCGVLLQALIGGLHIEAWNVFQNTVCEYRVYQAARHTGAVARCRELRHPSA